MNSLSLRRPVFQLTFMLLILAGFALQAQPVTKHIVVDQFGYRPASQKIAIIRNPHTGFDAAESFNPGVNYVLISKTTSEPVFTGSPIAWKNNEQDPSSGDEVWWFDFSSVNTPGTYYIVDVDNHVRSYEFEIGEAVYRDVLKHAVRTFFYQRAGFEKTATFAGAAWADGASHVGDLQDKNARLYNDKTNSETEVDVHGGWYDAGDYNKYTSWTANYIVAFMRAYQEAPGAWGDDYNLPESGNKIPDLLDEGKWGLDHLMRLQKDNGSVLSIVGLSHASPPSSATGPSLYGLPSTAATLNAAAAFALSAKVFGGVGMQVYANGLKERAIRAWNWAEANPHVLFKNNDPASGTSGLGAGQQETDDYGRLMAKLSAACFLFDITGDARYRHFFDAHYDEVHLMTWTYATPFETSNQEVLLYYTTLPGATSTVVDAIKSKYLTAMQGGEVFGAVEGEKDPYRAYIKEQDYTWGSNSTKASKGLIFTDFIHFAIDPSKNTDAAHAAEDFVHYLHGVNPLSMVYLSNMYAYGAENSVNEFYHTWFTDGSAKWDRVGTSTYGPAPGFVTGGPNPYYDWDGCCPNGCGNSSAICTSQSIAPPKGQPVQKSYKDFNTSWPLNSWSVTENSNGYQLNYIRLLSRFVPSTYDCSGTENGDASKDVCNRCAGGSTGIIPITDPDECNTITGTHSEVNDVISITPNPTDGLITVNIQKHGSYDVKIVNMMGQTLQHQSFADTAVINLGNYPAGAYVVIVQHGQAQQLMRIIKH